MNTLKYKGLIFATILLCSCNSITKDSTGEINKHDDDVEVEDANPNNNFKLELNCKTTKIAHREWTSENYKGTHFKNGDPIKRIDNDEQWDKVSRISKDPAYCIHDGEYYYNWYAINDPRGFAPEGWEVPSIEQWNQLMYYFQKDSIAPGVALRSNIGKTCLF
ncbi:FISUMP domain-containing protein [Crocinitomix algicola]|uniref:FISUMP domain-containing protein n=1 Tax=Crocinitomix algicola TaxID=1740263 RepID=UPI000871F57C|nr:FISUMP domain-containing protein [Crocinitomix algicola]